MKVRVRVYLSMRVHRYVCTSVWVYPTVHMHVRMFTSTYAYICVCVSVHPFLLQFDKLECACENELFTNHMEDPRSTKREL